MKTRSKTGKLKTLGKTPCYASDESPGSAFKSPDSDYNEHKGRKRFRKNDDQVKVLIQEFDKNPFWTKKLVLELSKQTGLSESQVYKWNWDYRKKIRKSEKAPVDNRLACKETLAPSRMEAELQKLQMGYKGTLASLPMATPSRFLYSGM
jgi:hypothetical protein